jgi:azurin
MKYRWFAVALLGLIAAPSWAASAACSTTVEANDAMQFNTRSIEVPKACKQFTVTLKHTGKLPKAAMGHDWVLSRAGDEASIDADGAKAGIEHDYLKPGDSRVIAHTKIIGGGETASTTFKVSALKAGESYEFFCSFPGHAALMKGTLTLK